MQLNGSLEIHENEKEHERAVIRQKGTKAMPQTIPLGRVTNVKAISCNWTARSSLQSFHTNYCISLRNIGI